jgi:hypothetical protein
LISAVIESEGQANETSVTDEKLDSVALDKAINMYHPMNG